MVMETNTVGIGWEMYTEVEPESPSSRISRTQCWMSLSKSTSGNWESQEPREWKAATRMECMSLLCFEKRSAQSFVMNSHSFCDTSLPSQTESTVFFLAVLNGGNQRCGKLGIAIAMKENVQLSFARKVKFYPLLSLNLFVEHAVMSIRSPIKSPIAFWL